MGAPRATVPAWVARYVGIPWEPRGREASGCDCWGLVRLVLGEQLGLSLPSYAGDYAGPADRATISELILDELPDWTPVSGRGRALDVALFRVAGQPLHVGVLVTPWRFLHTLEGAASCLELLRSPQWAPRLLGLYRPELPTSRPLLDSSRVLHASPFGRRFADVEIPAGATVAECLAAAGVDPETPGLSVWAGEREVPTADWLTHRPAAGECVRAVAVPAGSGQSSGKVLATIAILAIALTSQVALAPYVAGLSESAFLGAAAAMTATVAGALIVNALIPVAPANPAVPQLSDAPRAYSLTGARNQMAPWGVVPRVYGVHRFFPPLAAQPYTEIEGDDQYLVMLFDCGYGPLRVPTAEMKIGETVISNFSGIIPEVCGMGTPVTLYRNTIDTQTVNLALEYGVAQTPTTATDADEAIVQIVSAGLVQFEKNGWRSPRSVTFTIEYRETGTAGAWLTDGVVPLESIADTGVTKILDETYAQNWRTDSEAVLTTISCTVTVPVGKRVRVERSRYGLSWEAVALVETTGTVKIHPYATRQTDLRFTLEYWFGDFGYTWVDDTLGDIDDPTDWSYSIAETAGQVVITDQRETLVRRAVRVVFPARAQYDVRITRTTADSDDTRILDETTLSELQTVTYGSPVSDTVVNEHVLVALRVKATDQLQGQLDQFSVVAYALVPIWDGAAWETAETSNPAWAYAHELRGGHNDAQLADSRLDLDAILAWADACSDAGREYCAVHDTQATVFERLQAIAATGRATYSVADGAYTVVRDVEQTVPIQHFTPRNSWGFRGSKVFLTLPHAYRVRFPDRTNDWNVDERIIYVDGYTAVTATLYDDSLAFPGVTDPDQVAKDVYYHHAAASLRPETYEWFCDVEHLRCTRGDLVRVSHDVPLWGLKWGRIKDTVVSSGNTLEITLDEQVLMAAAKTYAINVRLASGSAVSVGVDLDVGTPTSTLTLSTPTAGPDVGDLVQFGESGSVAADLIIREIHPGTDLEARIVAVDAAPDIHDADGGELPAWNPQITIPPELNRPAPATPVIVSAEEFRLSGEDGMTGMRLEILFRIPVTLGVTVEWVEAQYREVGSTTWLRGPITRPDAGAIRINGLEPGTTYEARLRAVSNLSVASAWVETGSIAIGNYEVTSALVLETVTAWSALLAAAEDIPTRIAHTVTIQIGADITIPDGERLEISGHRQSGPDDMSAQAKIRLTTNSAVRTLTAGFDTTYGDAIVVTGNSVPIEIEDLDLLVSTPTKAGLYVRENEAPVTLTNCGFGRDHRTDTLDAAPAVDLGGGLVRIPVTGHEFHLGETVLIAGTTNYDGSYVTQAISSVALDITVGYLAETFSGSETIATVANAQVGVRARNATVHLEDSRELSPATPYGIYAQQGSRVYHDGSKFGTQFLRIEGSGLVLHSGSLPQYVSPEQYGATGDGVKSDDAAFALLAADLASGAVDRVRLRGEYRLTSATRFDVDSAPGPIVIEADGPAKIVFASTTDTRPFVIRNSTGVTVRGIHFLSEKTAATSNCLELMNCSDVLVEGCTFEDSTFYGLGVYEDVIADPDVTGQCNNVVVRGNTFLNVGMNGYTHFPKVKSEINHVYDNLFVNCGHNTLALGGTPSALKAGQGTVGAKIYRNIIYGTPEIGIACGNWETMEVFENTVFDCLSYGLAATLAYHAYPYNATFQTLTVRDNLFVYQSGVTNTEPILEVNGNLDSAGTVLIDGNRIFGGKDTYGIRIRPAGDVANIRISRNHIDGQEGGIPISLTNDAGGTLTGIVVEDNTVLNHNLAATVYRIEAVGCASPVFRRNKLVNMGYNAINFEDCTGTIYCEENEVDGYNLANSASKAAFNCQDSGSNTYYVRNNKIWTGNGYPKAIWNGNNATPTVYLQGNETDDVAVLATVNSTPNVVENSAVPFLQYGRQRQFYGTAAPASGGAYYQGDVTWNVAPTLGAAVGWVCTAGGSPGTWQAFGVTGSETFLRLTDTPASYSGSGGYMLRVSSGANSVVFQADPYDVGDLYPGAPTASLVIQRYPMPRAVTFPSGLTASRGVAGTAATAQTDFDLQKNGASFGTMRFAAAGTVASFISAAGASFAAGDVLTVVAPGSPDATLADLGWTLAGMRV